MSDDKPFLVVVVLAGAGAAGKTTLANSFAVGEPIETLIIRDVPTQKGIRRMRGKMTVYDNYAHIGNHKSGTDACNGPGIQYEVAFECAAQRDIIMFDSYVSSPQWVDIVNELSGFYNVSVLLIVFDIDLDTLISRMANRRGCTVADIHDPNVGGRIIERIKSGMTRPPRLRQQFYDNLDNSIPLFERTITSHTTSRQSVEILHEELCGIFSYNGLDYNMM